MLALPSITLPLGDPRPSVVARATGQVLVQESRDRALMGVWSYPQTASRRQHLDIEFFESIE